jgi:anti-sigma-K factor RskA
VTDLECRDRQDQILLYLAGALDEGESAELRQHLASGCPQCAGYRAEAEAILSLLPQSLDQEPVSPQVRRKLLERAAKSPAAESGGPIPINRGWEQVIIPASIAAVLAVAVTLVAVTQINKSRPAPGPDGRDAQIVLMGKMLQADAMSISDLRKQLDAATRPGIVGLRFAELTGPAQPDALGRVFVDMTGGKWYFFSAGMKPPAPGKTYELWLCCGDQKLPAGTFEPKSDGSASMSGAVPVLPANESITLAVTDEPMGGMPAPTGQMQIVGTLQ